jgi:signal peptidase I
VGREKSRASERGEGGGVSAGAVKSGEDTQGAKRRGEEEAEAPSTAAHIREQVTTLVLAVAIALGIRAFVIEPFRIPSGSMLPTLLIGDHLFVNKFIYGAKIPFSDMRLPALREPERGDVVVFAVARQPGRGNQRIYPADLRPDLPREDFVKRLVGLPGDRISVRNDRLYVNGEPVDRAEIEGGFVDDHGSRLDVYQESLFDCEHAILDDPQKWGLSKREMVVEPGRYFFMGDNRDNSNDSRGWGTVRKEELKGPAFILYWSWNVTGNFFQLLNPVNWFTAEKRWGRVFQRVKCGPVELD